ncbi:keratin, type I cytoskeletal 19 [Salminus brasiliensis]|uniref:keratin, type I cytoskeletal 19 n=1 Tax=Salminus brasiliensis TaxID=930266 RepID=UPI003B832F05
MSLVESSVASSRSLFPQKSYSNISSIGSGSLWGGGGSVRSSYGYSLGAGVGGGLRSQVGIGLGSGSSVGVGGLGAGSARFGSSLAVSGGRIGLGLAAGGGGGGGSGRFGWAAGGGGGGGAAFWTGGSSFADGGVHPFTTNEKLELQTLNDRLATYLDKVKRLETANHELEEKLRGFKANTVQVTYDMKAYQAQLQPLRDQFIGLLKDCSRLALFIDNAKLAADDYRIKFENELAARQTVEGDIAALKALNREYDLASAALTQEYQILLKDRDMIHSTHQKEVLSLRGQVAGTLTVDVQPADSMDLSRRLTDLRAEYETIVEKNHREIENWYTKKLETTQVETTHVTEVTMTGNTEIVTSRDQILTLQTQLDALLLQKSQQEQRLLDVQGQKQVQLLSLSRLAGGLEGELASVRESALQQARDYQLLLSTKVQLEREIATYKNLLEFAGDLSKFPGMSYRSSSWTQSSSSAPSTVKSLVAEARSESSVSEEGKMSSVSGS